MGSGGLRGLQIPRSGVQSVRGGFDSHTFPPTAAALALGILLVAGALAPRAVAAAPATTAARADSSATRAPATSDSAASARVLEGRDSLIVIRDAASAPAPDSARRAIPKTPLFDQPRMVMLRSLVVPGWGQLHNHSWIKAVGFAGLESWMVANVLRDRNDLDRLNDAVLRARAASDNDGEERAISEYNTRLDRYVGRQWTLAGVVTYAMLDAYVDAHFRNFDVEFGNDPALPEGFSPSRTRLSLRWHF